MSGTITAPPSVTGLQAGTADTDMQTLTDTYAQAQAFEAQMTSPPR